MQPLAVCLHLGSLVIDKNLDRILLLNFGGIWIWFSTKILELTIATSSKLLILYLSRVKECLYNVRPWWEVRGAVWKWSFFQSTWDSDIQSEICAMLLSVWWMKFECVSFQIINLLTRFSWNIDNLKNAFFRLISIWQHGVLPVAKTPEVRPLTALPYYLKTMSI